MHPFRRISVGLVAAGAFAAVLAFATPSEAADVCTGLATAIERAHGLAKVVLEAIAAYFGC